MSVLELFGSVVCCGEQGYRPNAKGRELGSTMLKQYVGSMNEFRQLEMAVLNEVQGGGTENTHEPCTQKEHTFSAD